MTISDVVRKTNVSTLFILPLFSDIAEGITYKLTTVPFNLIPLFYEYGLVKTYCYSYLSKDSNSLYLVFDRAEVTKKMSNTNKPGQTLNNLLLTSKHFNGLDIVNNYSIFNLTIPDEFKEDIELIKQGLYSKVSKKACDKMLVQTLVTKELLKSELAYKITQQNIGYAVCSKKPRIKEEFEKALDADISDDSEYYTIFSTEKETLTPQMLE